MNEQFLLTYAREIARLTVWLMLLAAIFVPLEHFLAVKPQRFFRKGLLQDIGFYAVNSFVPGILMAVPLALAAYAAHAVMPYRVLAFAESLPVWQRVLAAFVIGEIGFYWGHRWAHQSPFLWRFHAVHHQPEKIYFLVSARAHPIDNAFIRLCGLIPTYVLGLANPLTPSGNAIAALVVIVATLWGFFIHANLKLRLGPFEWLLATPGFHHWHHTKSDHKDRNFASMLPVMDWLFGTLYLPKKEWPGAYGTETPLPATLGGLMLYPLKPENEANDVSAPLSNVAVIQSDRTP